MAKKSKFNAKLVIAILLVLVSFVFFVIALNLDSILTLQEQQIPVRVNIGDNTAINVTTNQTVLHLGTVSRGNFASRDLVLSNDYDFPVFLEFNVRGNIEDLLVFSRRVYVESGENTNVTFYTKMIENEELGSYEGIINVKFKRAPVR